MLYTIFGVLFALLCFLLIGIILVQPGKGSMGLGSLGGGNQMLFGGSGGQDLFQKITWVLGSLFMGGSLLLSILRATGAGTLAYKQKEPLVQQAQLPNKN